jgi:hypothetical protein
MSTTDHAREKIMIIDWILRQEKSQNIKLFADLIEKLDKESAQSVKVVGYRAKGISVTWSQLLERVKDSMEEIESGKSISLDALEQESDKW